MKNDFEVFCLMTDVATSVLYNIGHILNSVKISIILLREDINKLILKI